MMRKSLVIFLPVCAVILAFCSAAKSSKKRCVAGPLQKAAEQGNLDEVKRLIAQGENISAADACGDVALNNAIDYDHLDVAELLINKGADVNTRDILGRVPLHWAARKGPLAMVELLLEKKSDINAREKYGETPLHWAVGRGRLQMTEFLIDHGADINARDNAGKTPLYEALEGAAPLQYRDRSVRVAKLLISKGADVTSTDSRGETPLHIAASWGFMDVAKLLIEKGADVNAKDNRVGFTPLHSASYSGDLEMAQLLVAHGADVNAKNDELGLTPLHRAARWSRNAGVVEFLIKQGADVNAKDRRGVTPLASAVAGGNKEVVDLLRQHQGRSEHRCSTARDVEATNRRTLSRLFDLKGLKAKLFLALDPRLLESNGKFDVLMEQNVNEIIVWRLKQTHGLAAAIPFAGGCTVEGYGEPDELAKIKTMSDVADLICERGLEEGSVRDKVRSLMTYGMPKVPPEVLERQTDTALKRIQGLLRSE